MHVVLIRVKMEGLVMMENVLVPFTVKEKHVKFAGAAILIHAKMEAPVSKLVVVIVHQTLLDQNVKRKLTSVIQIHAMDKNVPMEYVNANLVALENTAKIATLVFQTHVKMEAIVTMASVLVHLDFLESIVKQRTHVSRTHAKMEELAPMERVSAHLASRERSVKHPTLVSQTHAKMEELAKMVIVLANLAVRERIVKNAIQARDQRVA